MSFSFNYINKLLQKNFVKMQCIRGKNPVRLISKSPLQSQMISILQIHGFHQANLGFWIVSWLANRLFFQHIIQNLYLHVKIGQDDPRILLFLETNIYNRNIYIEILHDLYLTQSSGFITWIWAIWSMIANGVWPLILFQQFALHHPQLDAVPVLVAVFKALLVLTARSLNLSGSMSQ